MYSILTLNELTECLKALPTIREATFKDITEIRYHIGLGCFICKLLAQKSANNEDAIKLYHSKMKELYEK